MASPAPTPPGKPDPAFIEEIFEQKEFQARLQKAVLKLALAFLAALGITVTGVVLWFGKTLMDGAQAIRNDVAAKQSDAVKRLDQTLASFAAAQTKVQDMEMQARAASVRAVEASQDAARQGGLLMSQGNALTSSTRLVTEMIERTQRRLEENATALALATTGVHQQAEQLRQAQATLRVDQEKIQQRQAELDRAQQGIDALRQKIEPDVNQTMKSITSLRALAGEVARYKTMEFVSLRRNSVAEIGLRHVEVNTSGGMESPAFHLLFSTGKLKPLNLRLQVNRARTFTYPDVDAQKTRAWRPARSAYCICGTPFMFRVENYVQEVLMHDFVTLKILDRTDECEPPQLPPGASCPASIAQ